MIKRPNIVWSVRLFALIAAVSIMGSLGMGSAGDAKSRDSFEMTRAYVQTWVSQAAKNVPILSSSHLKEKILHEWDDQSKRHQIVSVRKPDTFSSAGHIPNSINVYWVDIATDEGLSHLDPDKTLVLYCNYGHASMISATILGLLGYDCLSLDFGMMDWNLEAMIKKPWDQSALPIISVDETEAKSIIREMVNRYFSHEVSPVIRSHDLKALLDDWDQNDAEYQIVDVRPYTDYKIGHIPHAINIPWEQVAEIENLQKLDPNRTVIVYCRNGQLGQLATTVLNLLGYRAVDLLFGMADWNSDSVDKEDLWDGTADYPLEYAN